MFDYQVRIEHDLLEPENMRRVVPTIGYLIIDFVVTGIIFLFCKGDVVIDDPRLSIYVAEPLPRSVWHDEQPIIIIICFFKSHTKNHISHHVRVEKRI